MNSKLQLVFLRIMRVFVLERIIPPLVITFELAYNQSCDCHDICKQSVGHVSTTVNMLTASCQILFMHYFCFCSFLIIKKVSIDTVQNLSIIKKKCPWTRFSRLLPRPGLCSSRAWWPLAPNFSSRATRKSQIFHTNHMLGTLDVTVSEH